MVPTSAQICFARKDESRSHTIPFIPFIQAQFLLKKESQDEGDKGDKSWKLLPTSTSVHSCPIAWEEIWIDDPHCQIASRFP